VTQALNTLFVQTQGAYLHLEHDAVKIEVERATVARVPLHHLSSITVFGNVLISPFLMARCADDGRDINVLTEHGRFRARIHGSLSGNVLLRRAQYSALDDPGARLEIARRFVAGKIQNARGTLMRAARETQDPHDWQALRDATRTLETSLAETRLAPSVDELRGVEGNAARVYFAAFTHLVRANREDFAFTARSKRPPRDPVNALLSFIYALLTADCVAALEGVGLDPQVGFLHALRPGRPALALDLIEEFRSFIADRLALTLINRAQITRKDFIEHTGGAWSLIESGRKTVLVEYQTRKRVELTHPVTQTTVPLGLAPHLQARLLARHLRGDLETYPPFIPKV
jgi:CRISPR-associated protein Cas1